MENKGLFVLCFAVSLVATLALEHDHRTVNVAVSDGSPTGFWRTRQEWKGRWVKEWRAQKVWIATWKKVWTPLEVKEWVPLPKTPPSWKVEKH